MDVVTRTAKELYERRAFSRGKKQLWEFLFDRDNTDLASSFALDKLVGNAYGVRYTVGQSAVREYQPGQALMITPPKVSEKTPLTGDLLDSVAAGVESTAGFDANKAAIVKNTISDHFDAFTMTKNYQALRVLREGKFVATGMNGSDIDSLSISYGRDGGNDLTHDFTVTAAFTAGIQDAVDLMLANGAGSIVAIMGKNWRGQFGGDSEVLDYMKSNGANQLLTQELRKELAGVEGLNVLADFRSAKQAVPVTYCSYQPGAGYVSHEGAAAVPFVGDDEIVFFAMGSPRYAVHRGIDIKENGQIKREAGPIVVDRFSSDDPVAEFLRSSSRHAFVPADIAQTVRVTGTFA